MNLNESSMCFYEHYKKRIDFCFTDIYFWSAGLTSTTPRTREKRTDTHQLFKHKSLILGLLENGDRVNDSDYLASLLWCNISV